MKGLIWVGRATHLWAPAPGHFKGVFEAFLKGLPCPAESWGLLAQGPGFSPCPVPQMRACPALAVAQTATKL